jgi:CSLREA domain-containing protein
MVVVLGAVPSPRASANGATFVVTTTADTGDGVCDSTCTLRDAVTESNAGSGAPDFISLPAGTFTLTGAGGENLNASGDLDVTRRVGIAGAGVATTIIDGGAIEAVFDVQDSAVQLNLSQLTVRNALLQGVISHASQISLSQVLFSQNTGGGVISDSGCVTADFSSFDSNGGIGIDTTLGCVTLDESTVSRNDGDGITTTTGTVLTLNSTISDNDGDGILTIGGDVTLSSTTVADNTGIAIDLVNGGTITLNGTIVTGVDSVNCSQAVEDSDHSLSSDASCGLSGTGDIENGNANLGPLQDNGGQTATRLPLAGSQAIDAGGISCPENDQRDLARPSGAACDIGSVEIQGAQAPTSTSTPVCQTQCATDTATPTTRLKTHTPTVTRTAEPSNTPPPPTSTNTPAPPAPTGDRGGVVRGPDTGSGGASGGSPDFGWPIAMLAAAGAGALAVGLRRRRA